MGERAGDDAELLKHNGPVQRTELPVRRFCQIFLILKIGIAILFRLVSVLFTFLTPGRVLPGNKPPGY